MQRNRRSGLPKSTPNPSKINYKRHSKTVQHQSKQKNRFRSTFVLQFGHPLAPLGSRGSHLGHLGIIWRPKAAQIGSKGSPFCPNEALHGHIVFGGARADPSSQFLEPIFSQIWLQKVTWAPIGSTRIVYADTRTCVSYTSGDMVVEEADEQQKN